MSYTVTSYPQGTFSWVDVASTDIKASKYFLEQLFGWTSQDMPTGPKTPDYTMFYLDGQEVAGGSPTFAPNMPSNWSNFISVTNVDTITAKAEKLGANIVMPAMDVFDSGRMATIQDPTGAFVSFWQAGKHIGARVVNKVGAMCWNELYTTDIEKAKTFYSELLGWTYDIDQENGYTSISNQGRSNGGMMEISPEMGPMPPNWTVYFTVADLDASLKKVVELNGKLCMEPKTFGVGRIAMINDPAGATMTLIQMAVKPDEWVDPK